MEVVSSYLPGIAYASVLVFHVDVCVDGDEHEDVREKNCMIDDGFAYIGDRGFDFHDDDAIFWRLVVRIAIKDSVLATEDIIEENIFVGVVIGVNSSECWDSGVVETCCWVDLVGCWLNADFLELTLVEDCSRDFCCEGEQVFHGVDVPVEDERVNVART